MSKASELTIHDVSLRDGLQNERVWIPLTNRLQIVTYLISAGIKHIQVGSFVHPDRVPQMKDIEAFIASLPYHEAVSYSGLVLNEKGLDRCLSTNLQQVDLSLSCSETHSLKNTGLTLEAARRQVLAMIPRAKRQGRSVRVGLQCAVACAYEGRIPKGRLLQMTRDLWEAGADHVCWADSTGAAFPSDLKCLLADYFSASDRPLILHLHDTRGLAMANFISAYEAGVRAFDASLGGVGGCPFIPGAAGNIAVEDIVAYCQYMSLSTGINLRELLPATMLLEKLLDYPLPGKIYQLERKSMAGSQGLPTAAGHSLCL